MPKLKPWFKTLSLIFVLQEELPLTPVIVAAPTTAELDANLAVEELYSKYRKLQQQLEFLEVQVTMADRCNNHSIPVQSLSETGEIT